MIRLVRKRIPPPLHEPEPRLWLVFFGDGNGASWWDRFLPEGFRHVCAAAWYADQERWVFYDPLRRGTIIEVWREDEWTWRFGELLRHSAVVLRVRSRHDRACTPRGWWCTGAIKALLGTSSCALLPKSLLRHLLREGAEIVCVETVQAVSPAAGGGAAVSPAAGGPGGQAAAGRGAGAGRARARDGHPGAAQAGDARP